MKNLILAAIASVKKSADDHVTNLHAFAAPQNLRQRSLDVQAGVDAVINSVNQTIEKYNGYDVPDCLIFEDGRAKVEVEVRGEKRKYAALGIAAYLKDHSLKEVVEHPDCEGLTYTQAAACAYYIVQHDDPVTSFPLWAQLPDVKLAEPPHPDMSWATPLPTAPTTHIEYGETVERVYAVQVGFVVTLADDTGDLFERHTDEQLLDALADNIGDMITQSDDPATRWSNLRNMIDKVELIDQKMENGDGLGMDNVTFPTQSP